MKQIKSEQIWLYNDKYYIRAYSQTAVGLRRARDDIIHVISIEETSSLSKIILEAFNECEMGIPHPDFYVKQPRDKLLDLMGLKTHKELEKKGKALSIYLEENQLEITPWFFNGKNLEGKEDIYCSLDPEEIMKTVLEAFEQCKSY